MKSIDMWLSCQKRFLYIQRKLSKGDWVMHIGLTSHLSVWFSFSTQQLTFSYYTELSCHLFTKHCARWLILEKLGWSRTIRFVCVFKRANACIISTSQNTRSGIQFVKCFHLMRKMSLSAGLDTRWLIESDNFTNTSRRSRIFRVFSSYISSSTTHHFNQTRMFPV